MRGCSVRRHASPAACGPLSGARAVDGSGGPAAARRPAPPAARSRRSRLRGGYEPGVRRSTVATPVGGESEGDRLRRACGRDPLGTVRNPCAHLPTSGRRSAVASVGSWGSRGRRRRLVPPRAGPASSRRVRSSARPTVVAALRCPTHRIVALAWDGAPTGEPPLRSRPTVRVVGWGRPHADASHGETTGRPTDRGLNGLRRPTPTTRGGGEAASARLTSSRAGVTTLRRPAARSGSGRLGRCRRRPPGILGATRGGGAVARRRQRLRAEPETARVRFAVLPHTVTTNGYGPDHTDDDIAPCRRPPENHRSLATSPTPRRRPLRPHWRAGRRVDHRG